MEEAFRVFGRFSGKNSSLKNRAEHSGCGFRGAGGSARTGVLVSVILLLGLGAWWGFKEIRGTGSGTERIDPGAGAGSELVEGGRREKAPPVDSMTAPRVRKGRGEQGGSRGAGEGTGTPAGERELLRLEEHIHRLQTTFLDPNTSTAQKLSALEELVRNPYSRERAYMEIAEVLTDHPNREIVEGALDIARRHPNALVDSSKLLEIFDSRFQKDLAFRLKVIDTLGANRKYPGAKEALEYLKQRHSSGILQDAIERALGEHH